jgi:hypothetical protein
MATSGNNIDKSNELTNHLTNHLTNDLINNLLVSILDKKILELLKIISSNYPDKFPKKNINLEIEFIKKNIKFINPTIINKSNNLDIVNNISANSNNKTNIKPNPKPKVVNKVLDINRCNARIWNNIYDRETLKEVSDIDKKTQCKRSKTSDSIYCFQHKIHSIHGNIFEIPAQELCLHYMKDGNYL